MPRNPTGEYTLPLPPVISGAIIEADWANQTLADISQVLTDSLSRTAQGSMSNPLKIVDGSSAAPGLAFVNEANTGFHRPDAGDLYVSILGADYMRWTDDNGVQISTDGGTTWSTVETGAVAADREVTAIGWAPNTLTLTKANGNLTVEIDTFDNLTVNTTLDVTGAATVGALQIAGEVNQLSEDNYGSSGNITILSLTANRHLITNNGSINLTIDEPVGARNIGENYTVEGTILFVNSVSAGIVTIVGATGDEVLGSNPTTASTRYILTYLIHYNSGVKTRIFVWSAV